MAQSGRDNGSVSDRDQQELIGNFKNPGKTWCRRPREVNEHDYSSQAECLAVPFGIYDVMKNTGYVVVGMSHKHVGIRRQLDL